MGEQERERARTKLEDAVWAALEADMSEEDVRAEVENAIEGHGD